MKKVLAALPLLLLLVSCEEAARIRIAVPDLEPKGVGPTAAAVFSDLLRSALAGTGVLEVVEPGEREQVLAEEMLDRTGGAAADYAVQMGDLLKTQKTIMGTLSAFGPSYIIDIRVVDVASARVDLSESVQAQSEVELADAMERLAGKLVATLRSGA